MRKTNSLIIRTLQTILLMMFFSFIFPKWDGLSQNVDKKHIYLNQELYVKLNKSICLSISVKDLKMELEEINSILTAEPLTNANHIDHTL